MADGSEWFRSEGKTCEEIAAALGVSKERIRQLEVRAIRKCREWCQRNNLNFEDLTSVWSVPDWDRTGD